MNAAKEKHANIERSGKYNISSQKKINKCGVYCVRIRYFSIHNLLYTLSCTVRPHHYRQHANVHQMWFKYSTIENCCLLFSVNSYFVVHSIARSLMVIVLILFRFFPSYFNSFNFAVLLAVVLFLLLLSVWQFYCHCYTALRVICSLCITWQHIRFIMSVNDAASRETWYSSRYSIAPIFLNTA